jgi:hypothetical protein
MHGTCAICTMQQGACLSAVLAANKTVRSVALRAAAPLALCPLHLNRRRCCYVCCNFCCCCHRSALPPAPGCVTLGWVWAGVSARGYPQFPIWGEIWDNALTAPNPYWKGLLTLVEIWPTDRMVPIARRRAHSQQARAVAISYGKRGHLRSRSAQKQERVRFMPSMFQHEGVLLQVAACHQQAGHGGAEVPHTGHLRHHRALPRAPPGAGAMLGTRNLPRCAGNRREPPTLPQLFAYLVVHLLCFSLTAPVMASRGRRCVVSEILTNKWTMDSSCGASRCHHGCFLPARHIPRTCTEGKHTHF